MSIRAKFKVQKVEASQTMRKKLGGADNEYETVEIRTIMLQPVYAVNGDPNHENTKFWNASPSGEIKLGTINQSAWEAFELGGEYYVDFTKAE